MFHTDTKQRDYKAITSLGLPLLQPDTLGTLAVTYLYLIKEAKLLSFLTWLGKETDRDVSYQVVLLLEYFIYFINKRPRCVSPSRL